MAGKKKSVSQWVYSDDGTDAPPPGGKEDKTDDDGRKIVKRNAVASRKSRNRLVYADTGNFLPKGSKEGTTGDGRVTMKVGAWRAQQRRNKLVYADTGESAPDGSKEGDIVDGREIVTKGHYDSWKYKSNKDKSNRNESNNQPVYADTGMPAPEGSEVGKTDDGREILIQADYNWRHTLVSIDGKKAPKDSVHDCKIYFYRYELVKVYKSTGAMAGSKNQCGDIVYYHEWKSAQEREKSSDLNSSDNSDLSSAVEMSSADNDELSVSPDTDIDMSGKSDLEDCAAEISDFIFECKSDGSDANSDVEDISGQDTELTITKEMLGKRTVGDDGVSIKGPKKDSAANLVEKFGYRAERKKRRIGSNEDAENQYSNARSVEPASSQKTRSGRAIKKTQRFQV